MTIVATTTAAIAANSVTVSIPDTLMDFVRRQVQSGASASESEYVHELLIEALHRAQIDSILNGASTEAPSPEWIAAERKKSEQWWANLSEQRRNEIEDMIDKALANVERGEVSEFDPNEYRQDLARLVEARRAKQ
ncbi:MAG: hypothetical protein K2X38_25250 [Gemmataceae bacterium]|nr:hypothetical protein [Gemmataceae bacterium]